MRALFPILPAVSMAGTAAPTVREKLDITLTAFAKFSRTPYSVKLLRRNSSENRCRFLKVRSTLRRKPLCDNKGDRSNLELNRKTLFCQPDGIWGYRLNKSSSDISPVFFRLRVLDPAEAFRDTLPSSLFRIRLLAIAESRTLFILPSKLRTTEYTGDAIVTFSG